VAACGARIGVTVSFDNGAHGRTRENYYRLTESPLVAAPHRAAPRRFATWRHLSTARARPTSSFRELTLPRRRRSTLPVCITRDRPDCSLFAHESGLRKSLFLSG